MYICERCDRKIFAWQKRSEYTDIHSKLRYLHTHKEYCMSKLVPNQQLADIQKLLEEAVKALAKMAEPKDPKLTGFREPCDVPNLLKDPKWDDFVPGVGPIHTPAPLYYTVPGTAVPWWDSTQDTVLVKKSALDAKDEEVSALNREIDQRDAAMRNQKSDIERLRRLDERKAIIIKEFDAQNRELRVEKSQIEAQLRNVTKDRDRLTIVALSNAKARDEALEALARYRVANERLQKGRDEQERENNVLRARNEKLHDELGASSMKLRDTLRKIEDAQACSDDVIVDTSPAADAEKVFRNTEFSDSEWQSIQWLKDQEILELLDIMKEMFGFLPDIKNKKENQDDS